MPYPRNYQAPSFLRDLARVLLPALFAFAALGVGLYTGLHTLRPIAQPIPYCATDLSFTSSSPMPRP